MAYYEVDELVKKVKTDKSDLVLEKLNNDFLIAPTHDKSIVAQLANKFSGLTDGRVAPRCSPHQQIQIIVQKHVITTAEQILVDVCRKRHRARAAVKPNNRLL